MTEAPKLTKADLMQFTGTEHWYRHPFNRAVLYTDGAKFVAERAGAYWLLDEIALLQRYEPRVSAEVFQAWKLKVGTDRSAVLTCGNGSGRVVYTKRIPLTDFPLPEIVLYFTDGVILLPSEY
jgi:hypothetical protein